MPAPTVAQSSSNHLDTCKLLALPPELRNSIFYLTSIQEPETNLLKATGPSTALLLTSRQTNSEARGFYRDAHTTFWSTTKFVLSTGAKVEDVKATSSKVLRLNNQNLALVTHLTIRCGEEKHFMLKDGLWRGYRIYYAPTLWIIFGKEFDTKQFVHPEVDGEIERAKVLVGWTGLTKEVLHGLVEWYLRNETRSSPRW